jgi:hypothetical protein
VRWVVTVEVPNVVGLGGGVELLWAGDGRTLEDGEAVDSRGGLLGRMLEVGDGRRYE